MRPNKRKKRVSVYGTEGAPTPQPSPEVVRYLGAIASLVSQHELTVDQPNRYEIRSQVPPQDDVTEHHRLFRSFDGSTKCIEVAVQVGNEQRVVGHESQTTFRGTVSMHILCLWQPRDDHGRQLSSIKGWFEETAD